MGSRLRQFEYVARLEHLNICIDIVDEQAFWNIDAASRAQLIKAIHETGAKAILTKTVPVDNERQQWRALASGYYHVLVMPD
jgi:hypothetical protein